MTESLAWKHFQSSCEIKCQWQAIMVLTGVSLDPYGNGFLLKSHGIYSKYYSETFGKKMLLNKCLIDHILSALQMNCTSCFCICVQYMGSDIFGQWKGPVIKIMLAPVITKAWNLSPMCYFEILDTFEELLTQSSIIIRSVCYLPADRND